MMTLLERTGRVAGSALFDFGKDAFAQLSVELTGQGGEAVELAIGEVLSGGRLNRNPGGYRIFRVMPLTLLPGTHRYEFEIAPHVAPDPSLPKRMPPPEAAGREIIPFRYVEINGYTGDIRLERRAFHAEFNDNAATFECSDDNLNRIWDFCKYSIKATTPFGCYVDGERERLPYEGDAYINQLGHFCCDASYRMAHDTIEYFFDHPTWPTEWSLAVPLLARDYMLYSGDTASVRAWLPRLREKLLLPLAGDDGLIAGNDKIRDIVDWPLGERDGYEFGKVNLVPNTYFYAALCAMGDMSGDDWYRRRATSVRDAIRRRMLKMGRFVDNPDSTHTSLHTAFFPIAFGVADPAEYPALNAVIRERGMACSVYGAQFLLEACYRSGIADHALALMTSHGKRGWNNMLACGATITMEAWDDSFKPNQDWNHAWGAAPANIIPRFLCGIRPQTPGFATYVCEPAVSGLAYIRYRQPTPQGGIVFEYENGKWQTRRDD